MAERTFFFLWLIFTAAFFGIACSWDCSVENKPTFSSSSAASSIVSSTSSVDENEAPVVPRTITGISGASLPSACLYGDGNGGRKLSTSQGRLTLLLRLRGVNGNFVRGAFSLVDDILNCYGFVRPHLYLCRLLI